MVHVANAPSSLRCKKQLLPLGVAEGIWAAWLGVYGGVPCCNSWRCPLAKNVWTGRIGHLPPRPVKTPCSEQPQQGPRVRFDG